MKTKQIYIDNHILLLSAYSTPEMHAHTALHILLGEDNHEIRCAVGAEKLKGKCVFIDSDVLHTAQPETGRMLVFLLDPTSSLADKVRKLYLKNHAYVVMNEMDINIPLIKLGYYGAALGITRWIPSLAESDAIKYGTLSENGKDIYRAVFYQRTATKTMINEVEMVKENANTVKNNGIPDVPMLLFISDGSGGTGFTKEEWRSIPEEYISKKDNASYIELDCPHYVHDYEYKKISEEIEKYLK